MKRGFSALLFAALFLLQFVVCFAENVTVDGEFSAREWEGGEQHVLSGKGEESNCEVSQALIRVLLRREENAAYFLFVVSCPGTEGSTLHGASLSVCGSEPVRMLAQNSPLNYDTNMYNFRSCVSNVNGGSFVCEARVGFKHGMPEQVSAQARAIDCKGEPSTVYALALSPQPSEAEPSTTLTEPTAAVKTTISTSAFEPGNYTTYASEKTTRKKASTTKKTAKTTRAKTTKVKTTKAPRVSSTHPKAGVRAVSSSVVSTMAAVSIVELSTAAITVPNENANKKIYIAFATGAALMALVFWCIKASKKPKTSSSDTAASDKSDPG